MQKFFIDKNSHKDIKKILQDEGINKPLLVVGKSFDKSFLKDYFLENNISVTKFNEFSSNPTYESVKKGKMLFSKEKCDGIIAIGGGSAIDVAKCIKLFSNMNDEENYLHQPIKENSIKLIALPTTAGTGSESTRFAVIYYKGEKQSVANESIIPDYVILEPDVLITLPVYQKKCTLLDALCQAIEAYWSVNSNEESKEYSKQAISLIMDNIWGYLKGEQKANLNIMLGANYAGRAINITQTTAAHAMSYKITSMYGLPHGHAVAICLPYLWEFMNNNLDKTIDTRGSEYLKGIFNDLAKLLNQKSIPQAIEYFKSLLRKMEITSPNFNDEDLDYLSKSVNTTRLKNNPVALAYSDIYSIYTSVIELGA
jgi:alcohol dehydrogenase class IV